MCRDYRGKRVSKYIFTCLEGVVKTHEAFAFFFWVDALVTTQFWTVPGFIRLWQGSLATKIWSTSDGLIGWNELAITGFRSPHLILQHVHSPSLSLSLSLPLETCHDMPFKQ